MIKFSTIKLDKLKEGADGAAPTETKTPPANEKDPKTPETPGNNVDEYGYEKEPKADDKADKVEKPNKDGAKKDDKAPEEIQDPATGYGIKEPKEEKKEDPPPPPPEEKKIELEFELEVKDLDKDEANKIKEFVKNNKLPKEAAQALVDLKKSEIAEIKKATDEYKKEQAKAVADLKASWDKELRTDPNFGGDKFAHNITRVEKLMTDFLGETKKVLTERKSMLPPYVMRDLARLADKLYATDKLVQGDPSGEKETAKKEENDPLAFYT